MDYHVIFHDGSEKKISEKTYQNIISASSGDGVGFEMDGGFYKFSAISKILNSEDYLTQYPAKQKYNYGQPYDNSMGTVYTRSTKHGRELMLKGFKKFLDKHPEAKKAAAFYEQLKTQKTSEILGGTYEPKYKTVDEMVAAGILKKRYH